MGTHPAAGHFETLGMYSGTSSPPALLNPKCAESWKQSALGTINKALREPLSLNVVNVVGGGDEDWALVELEANSVCKNGMEYPQRYAWVMRFDKSNTIVQVRAYLDSALVQQAVDSNS
ncbi:hypothetical protein LTR36_005303 [Oleoguttula mirabilis]|uniref:SnoaL-like domain-containing protein n=1 Tax=Oleoguttula mirabilis TaxID=1507867 RepID=A0AAV9JFT2_9PEZI|nr:hypothetical protein LTR36_005303 [Oleoguttula mirabilis]